MRLNIKKVRDFINPLLSKKSIDSNKFGVFRNHLEALKQLNQGESEEHQKNSVRDFLANSFGYTVNTKGRIDLAIFKNHALEVIIEAKSLTNKTEMITQNELNRKAFAEAIKYFMDERKSGNNNVRHIIILTAFEWFVFDAKDFERLFWQDKDFKKIYNDYTNPNSLLSKTGDVYNEFSALIPKKKSITNLFEDLEIDCAYFNLKEDHSEKNLIAIYKLLSSDCLLKEFDPNDANSLNREFYNELLYILGLEEEKVAGKKLIGRAKNPQSGSLFENIFDKLTQYGKSNDFESIIKLMIIWINRILFLKLLESQIIKWNDNKEYRFLNAGKIDDYDKLEMLFFEILAKKQSDRKHREFDHIPYLNSSLFEPHEMEESGMRISNLYNADIKYSPKTVIKDSHRTKKTGEVKTLHYLFEFLDAYDFSSDGTEEIGTDNKALINASVLGLIFEKLNGYKDGSFYTPSFITMYMARESITKAVLAKFNEFKGWNCQNLVELYNKIDDSLEANILIDSLKICDPAVGSGHFLVSALNEILFIKSELGVLIDEEGKRIRDYRITVENDELIVKDEEGEIFEYKRDSREKSRIQKTLFKEKQNIIENCLFGVDINPNSVNICRLRLWIELLKNAYYKEDGALDTLPNIDINIKWGNSLISRFALTDELKIKNIVVEIENYKQRVSDYKENLGTKKDVMRSISDLKDKFRLTLKAEWKASQNRDQTLKSYTLNYGYDKLSRDLILTAIEKNYRQHGTLFEYKPNQKEQKKLFGQLVKYQSDIDEIEQGKIYDNAFEWRFEFPEVLDANGDFVGFDVVIGNPPYVFAREHFTPQEKSFFVSQYKLSAYQLNLYILFLERSNQILKQNGQFSFIVPNNWLTINSAKGVREFILSHSDIGIVNFTAKVFDEANVDTAVLTYNKSDQNPIVHLYESSGIEGMNLIKTTETSFFLAKTDAIINIEAFKNAGVYELVDSIETNALPLKEVADVKAGLKAYETGKGKPPQSEEMKKNRVYHSVEQLDENYLPYLDGKDVSRYALGWSGEFLKYADNLAATRTFGLFSTPRILVRQIPSRPPYCIHACYTDAIILNDLNSMNIVNIKESPLFILGVLNSRLMSFWFIHKFGKLSRGIFPQFKINELEQFPIIKNVDAKIQNIFSVLVNYILFLKQQDFYKSDDLKFAKDRLMVAFFERLIDAIVYELYFPHELHKEDKFFISILENENLLSIDRMNDKTEEIRVIFDILNDKNHIIKKNLFFLDSVEVVRIIEGKENANNKN